MAAESLSINKGFADKYAHNKEREEISRARELGLAAPGEEGSDSSSSSDDEDAEMLTRSVDKQIQRTLDMIKRGDPAIYDAGTQLYNSDETSDSEDDSSSGGSSSSDDDSSDDSSDDQTSSKPKRKPVTIKDQLRERIMKKIDADESASDSGSDDDGGDLTRPSSAAGPTFVEEQAALKKEFGQLGGARAKSESLDDSGSDSDSDGGLFKLREKTEEEQAAQDATIEASFAKMAESEAAKEKAGDAVLARAQRRKVDNGDGMEEQTEMDAADFLNDYVMNQRWLDKPGKKRKKRKAAVVSTIAEDDEDGDFETATDKYEASYNFRYEEAEGGGSTDIVGHARRQGAEPELGLARRPDDRRKQKRANKKKRKQEEKEAAALELRRLKNLKRAELEKKLAKIEGVSGVRGRFTVEDLDEDFNDTEWDAKMAEQFGDDFYADEAAAQADRGLALDNSEDEDETGGKEQTLKKPVFDDGLEELDAAMEAKAAAKRAKKAKKAALASATEMDALDELYALDYEDIIGGDLKTRFKYRQVRPNYFGFDPVEILESDEKDLNKKVSLKKLAPYRDEHNRAQGRGGGSGKVRATPVSHRVAVRCWWWWWRLCCCLVPCANHRLTLRVELT
jgi:protein KRI1